MSPFFSYFFLCFLLLHHLRPICIHGRTTPKFKLHHNTTWHKFGRFLDSGRGSHITGLSELKKYFHRFGYLTLHANESNITDVFDSNLEIAVANYQAKLGLQVTRKLDSDTLFEISLPRCGIQDTTMTMQRDFPMHAGQQHYVLFPGKPRWARGGRLPIRLRYAFSPENMIDYLSLYEIRSAIRRVFAKWASVIPVTFSETNDYAFADIKIGFYSGDHGDGEPFDGALGVLAHAFSPESGKLHFDAAERWAVDFGSEKSAVAVDLESVATHEIGHVLGLAHSFVKESIMYPSLKPRDKKLDLQVDDIKGVQALYGSNPNFSFGSLLAESDTSSNRAVDSTVSSFNWSLLILNILILCLCI